MGLSRLWKGWTRTTRTSSLICCFTDFRARRGDKLTSIFVLEPWRMYYTRRMLILVNIYPHLLGQRQGHPVQGGDWLILVAVDGRPIGRLEAMGTSISGNIFVQGNDNLPVELPF